VKLRSHTFYDSILILKMIIFVTITRLSEWQNHANDQLKFLNDNKKSNYEQQTILLQQSVLC